MRKLLAILALCLCAATVWADVLSDGFAARERGDYATALRLLRPLAEQGLVDTQYNLGVMYARGEGVPQSYAEAATWLRKAAEQGFADAQCDLGLMYGKGEGVPQNYVEAHKWADLCASRATDAVTRDDAVKLRDAVASLLTPAQIAEAQKLAREWKPKQPRPAP